MMIKLTSVVFALATAASVSSAYRVDPGFAVDEPKSCLDELSACKDDKEFCAQGTCLPKGMCLNHFDCYNPNNSEPKTKCRGFKYCDYESLTCQHMCGEICPLGIEESPAKECRTGKTACDTYDIPRPEGTCYCEITGCGAGCGPLYLDCFGFPLQVPVDPEFGVDPPSFLEEVDPDFGVDPIPPEMIDPDYGVDPIFEPVDPDFGVDPPPGYEVIDPEFAVDPPDVPPQDCLDGKCPSGDGAYCDWEGNCLLVGKCTTTDDCYNELNGPYVASMCMGEIICNAGLCLKDCDEIVEKFDCSNKDNAPNIVEVVCKDKELSMLCDFLKDNKNKEEYKWLTNPNKRYTLFAPVNDAIENLPDKYSTTLKYHIAKGRASFAKDLSCIAGNNLVTMSNGKDTRTKCRKEVPYIQQGKGNVDLDIYPEFLETDIIACNGLIHKVSNVIILKA